MMKWEGTVQSIGPETFVAIIRDLDDNSAILERAEFELRAVSKDDAELLEVGAVFNLLIGHKDTPFVELKFRRLDWTAEEIKSLELTEDVDEFFA